MIAIDCGNTRIKWARFEGGARLDAGNATLRGDADPWEALSVALANRAGRVLVANVAGAEIAGHIARTVRSRLDCEPEFVTVEAHAYGIECAYVEPSSLGVDRWLAMIAVKSLVDGPFAVVCAGTATTFDAVDGAGRHLGGLIIPGDRLMTEAITNNTNQIGIVAPAGRAVAGLGLLGRSTREAVSHGARLAVAAAIDRAAATVAEALLTPIPLIVTGGDAAVLVDWLASDAEVRADLVLEGLAVVGRDEE